VYKRQTLTTTVTVTGSAPVATTLVKNTTAPGAPSLSAPAYINLGNRSAATFTITGPPGLFAMLTVSDGVYTIDAGDLLDAVTGSLSLTVDLTLLAEGNLTATASVMSGLASASSASSSSVTVNLVKDTVPPTGSFTISGTVINNQLQSRNPVALKLAFTDVGTGLSQVAFSTNGGTTFGPTVPYASTPSVTVSGPDGWYTIAVKVLDAAGNYVVVTQSVWLDTTGPKITSSMDSPTNGSYYDVGLKVTVNFSATDSDNPVATLTATLDGSTTLTSGGTIDMNTLTAGSHSIVINATDQLGNPSSVTVTFTIHPTVAGMINAVNQGVAAAKITSKVGNNLVGMLNTVQAAINAGNNAAAKAALNNYMAYVNSQSGTGITAAYATLLVNWAQDLYNRL